MFSLRDDLIENGGKNENGRVASPGSLPINLRTRVLTVSYFSFHGIDCTCMCTFVQYSRTSMIRTPLEP